MVFISTSTHLSLRPKTIAVAKVGSWLDYCNSLLAGTSASNLARLQMVQNTLARVVAQNSLYYHITPGLADLHWLLVVLSRYHDQQPVYLAQILLRYQGRHFTFSWGGRQIFFIFQCHRTTEKFEKQHFICSNFTLFIVPFLSFFSCFSFFFFSYFFLFSFSLRGDTPQPPSNDAPARYTFTITPVLSSITISAPLRKTSMAISKSFSSTASQVWNMLPVHISSALTLPVFRRHLKHHLYLDAYLFRTCKTHFIFGWKGAHLTALYYVNAFLGFLFLPVIA